jgi:tight adherence protein B
MIRSTRLLLAVVGVVAGTAAATSPGSVHAQAPSDPPEVILAIDASESMEPAIAAARAAANEFVASLPEDVRIGVETFSDDVVVLTPPTTDRSVVRTQIDSIDVGGDTRLYDVVVTASQHFSPTAEHQVLVLLSDGKDEGSFFTLDDAVAASEGLHVEAISLTTAETDLESLTALGPVTSADDAAGVSAAFARVADLVVEVIEPPAPTTPATTIVSPVTTVAAAPATVAPPTTVAAVTAPTDTSDSSGSSVWLWVGAAGVFAGIFLLAYLVVPRERVSRARLGVQGPRRASDMGVRTVSAVDEALQRYGKRADLDATLAMANISMKPADFVATVGVVGVVAGLVGLLLGGPIIAILVTGVVWLVVRFHVRRAKAKHQAAFADQLPDVLQLVTTALRSGFGITQALESVAEEAQEPARSEFAHVLAESRMGRDLSDSLHALAARMESKDLEWIVGAIDINREAGGNLSEILQKVSITIRERGRIHRQVRTLTAEGRLSAKILIVLPLLMLLWQWRVNPENFELLTSGVGLIALGFAGMLMVVGSLWVRKIVNSVAL